MPQVASGLLCGLAWVAAGAIVLVAIPAAAVLKHQFGRCRANIVSCLFLAVCLVHYAATKSVTYDGGLRAGTSPNWFTNDVVHLTWQRDTHGTVVPLSATVYIDYRPAGATNEEWGLLAQSIVGTGMWEGSVGSGLMATNFDYNVWAYYIPPEPVHTNGVWLYKTIYSPDGEKPVPVGARFELDGRTVVPPERKEN